MAAWYVNAARAAVNLDVAITDGRATADVYRIPEGDTTASLWFPEGQRVSPWVIAQAKAEQSQDPVPALPGRPTGNDPPPPSSGGGGEGGVTDHGELTGRGDDDHPQYARADGTRGSFASTTHTHVAAGLTDSTAAGRAVLTAADAAAQRTALGLGSAALAATGTTSGEVPLLGTGGRLPAARLGSGAAGAGALYLADDGTYKLPSGGDHGALTGLGDDDHTMYAKADGTRGSFAATAHVHDYAPATRALNAQTGTTYTAVLADVNRLVTLSNASAVTVTLPPNTDAAIPVGASIVFAQLGAGQVTFTPGAGVTVRAMPGSRIASQYGAVEAVKIATDEWLLVGRLAA